MADLATRIEDSAEAPQTVSADGVIVKEHQLPDLIAADKYLQTKTAATKKRGGLHITRMIMPGARGREPGAE